MTNKTTTQFALLAAAGLFTSSASAATINLTDFEQTDSTVSGFAVTVAASGNDWLYSFSQTGDLDGLGTDDTLTFDLRSSAFTATGFAFTGGDVTLGAAYDYSVGGTVTAPIDQHFGTVSGAVYDIDIGESFQLSIENIVFTQGEALGWAATFDGFNEMGIFSSPGGTQSFYLGIVGAELVTPAGSNYTLAEAQQVLTLTSATNNSKRTRDVDFSFTTAVPEPGTYALLAGLTGLAVVMVRRRRA